MCNMLSEFQNSGFLTELSSRIGFGSVEAASIEGSGKQAVIVAAGDSVYKVFTSSKNQCGVSAHNSEVAALKAIGGHEGNSIKTASLKSHFLFNLPFHVAGKDFVGIIEQSRIQGERPKLENAQQHADIGHSIAEFHSLLAERADHLTVNNNVLNNRIGLLNTKHTKGHVILPGLKKRLNAEVSKIALNAGQQYVHGDFHMGNVLFDGEKHAILDVATVGKSAIEQDMTVFVHDQNMLKHVFQGYAQHTGFKPNKGRAVHLYALDLGVAAEIAHRSGDSLRAEKFADRLQAVMS